MEFFATCQNIPIHISDTKKGERTLVFLHGYLETLYVWESITKQLAHNFRIISIDIPGHGLSGSRSDVNSMEFVADVLNQVLDITLVDSATIIGHSMGGYIAIEFSKKYSQRTEGLVLLNSTPFSDTQEKIIDRRREIELIKNNKLQNIAQVSVPKMFATKNLRIYDETVQEILEIVETHDPEGIVATINGMIERNSNLEYLEKYSKPLLLIFGSEDIYIPIEKAESLIQLCTKADSCIIDNTGHITFVEREAETIKIIYDFVDKHVKLVLP